MRFRRFTHYALRLLIYLGERPSRRCSVPEIAAAHQISESHLVKVANRLGRLGVVETTRGRGGGLRLATAPEAVSVGAIVRLLEGDEPLADCESCILRHDCRLDCVLHSAAGMFYAELDRVALRDILRSSSVAVHARRSPPV